MLTPPLRNTKGDATSDLIAKELFFPLHHQVPSTLWDQPDALCCGLAHGFCKRSHSAVGYAAALGVVTNLFCQVGWRLFPLIPWQVNDSFS